MEKILKLLDEYRKYPRFQLERHFDVILLEHVPLILNAYFSKQNDMRYYDIAFPEFPVRKKLVKDKYNSEYESVSVDYIVFDKINRRFCFIELKTDDKSNNTIQDSYLVKVNKLKIDDILNFLFERIESRKDSWEKYQYLFQKLVDNGILNKDMKSSENYSYIGDGVIKVIPRKNGSDIHATIEFTDILGYQIDNKGFELIKTYLGRWIESPKATIKRELKLNPKK